MLARRQQNGGMKSSALRIVAISIGAFCTLLLNGHFLVKPSSDDDLSSVLSANDTLPSSLYLKPIAARLLDATYYQMTGKHFRQDQYFTDTQKKNGEDFTPDLESEKVLVGEFTAGQSFLRVEILSDEDYQLPNVQEPLRQGLSENEKGICPTHFEDFEDLFSDLDQFKRHFLHVPENQTEIDPSTHYFPPDDTYPSGCTTDAQKIEYILGYWQGPKKLGKLQRALKNWRTAVTADVLVVPPPPPGGPMSSIRFQPAFAGMFLFYFDDPESMEYGTEKPITPFLYVTLASSGTGRVVGMYTNKVTTVPRRGSEPKMRTVQTVISAKFTPSSSRGSYYSHGMKVYEATGEAHFLTDVYYEGTPPLFFWNGRNQTREYFSHLRVSVDVEPISTVTEDDHSSQVGGSKFWDRVKNATADVIAPFKHIDAFAKATIHKAVAMEKFTSPYLANPVSTADVMKLVLDPNSIGSHWTEKLGCQVIPLLNFTDTELGISNSPHVISQAEYLKGHHLSYSDQTTG